MNNYHDHGKTLEKIAFGKRLILSLYIRRVGFAGYPLRGQGGSSKVKVIGEGGRKGVPCGPHSSDIKRRKLPLSRNG